MKTALLILIAILAIITAHFITRHLDEEDAKHPKAQMPGPWGEGADKHGNTENGIAP